MRVACNRFLLIGRQGNRCAERLTSNRFISGNGRGRIARPVILHRVAQIGAQVVVAVDDVRLFARSLRAIRVRAWEGVNRHGSAAVHRLGRGGVNVAFVLILIQAFSHVNGGRRQNLLLIRGLLRNSIGNHFFVRACRVLLEVMNLISNNVLVATQLEVRVIRCGFVNTLSILLGHEQVVSTNLVLTCGIGAPVIKHVTRACRCSGALRRARSRSNLLGSGAYRTTRVRNIINSNVSVFNVVHLENVAFRRSSVCSQR